MARPKSTPKKITVSLAQHHAEELQKLATEAGVSLSSLCAHVLERYAIQDRELMTNDLLTQRLERQLDNHMRQFQKRFGDILMRTAHETVAARRLNAVAFGMEHGKEAASKLQDATWQEAVKSLRGYDARVRGENAEEGEGAKPE